MTRPVASQPIDWAWSPASHRTSSARPGTLTLSCLTPAEYRNTAGGYRRLGRVPRPARAGRRPNSGVQFISDQGSGAPRSHWLPRRRWPNRRADRQQAASIPSLTGRSASVAALDLSLFAAPISLSAGRQQMLPREVIVRKIYRLAEPGDDNLVKIVTRDQLDHFSC
jgi:hypothetical protein